MRRTTMFALLGVALPGIAVAQTATPSSTAPSSTTPPSAMTQPQGGMGMHHHHHDRCWHHARWAMKRFHKKFDAANTTHDGHLTLAQAEKAGMKPIVKNFAAIDTQHRGYVTFNDVIAWRLDTMAARMEKRAADLRAKD
ncbi:hypothetical protein [Acidocella sp.]|uniref:hypothetical protein n=1 Tax=Acidocella sp. TaxID=50710 RepID=UPI002F3E250C